MINLSTVNICIKKVWMLSVFCVFINSMYPWFVWGNKLPIIICSFAFFISVCYLFLYRQTFVSFKKLSFLLLLFLAMVWSSRNRNVNGVIEFLFLFGILASIVLFKDSLKDELLKYITKWFSVCVGVTLFVFVLFICGFSVVSPTYIQYVDGRYPSFNFYFFLISVNTIESFFRFKSVFMEPGHLTMGLVPLIMANRFNVKNRYVLALVVVELFTFSLAGYITMFVGYLLFNLSFKRVKSLLGAVVFIVLSVWIIQLSGSSEILDRYLWNRLEYTDGTIAGNNRTTAEFDAVYNNVIHNSYLSLVGDDSVDIAAFGGISGYKKYIVTDGLIGVFFILVLYSYFYLAYKKKDVLIFTIVLLLLLYQNSYPFWGCIILMYILGCYHLKGKVV